MDKARILIIDDEESLRHMLSLVLRSQGWEVRSMSDGEAGLKELISSEYDLAICDVRMPKMGGLELLEELTERGISTMVIVMSAFGSRDLAIEALKRGAYDYIDKPFEKDEILLTVYKALERLRLERENRALRSQVNHSPGLERLIGDSPPMTSAKTLIQKVASFKSTVLLNGESGTGKELAARAIHDLSPRKDGPFVAINCGAIPAPLLESELFGHRRGAFTDATADKDGLFTAADKGTLFLDEIAELPLELQVKLLRVLQDNQIRPLGASESHHVDVRIIAATHHDLEERVRARAFREDLFYRLHVIALRMPPLRERREDIPRLVEHFISIQNHRLGTKITGVSREVLQTLTNYSWPGNVRELQNCIERGMVLCDGLIIDLKALPEQIRASQDPMEEIFHGEELSIKKLSSQLERILITRALAKTEGNRTHAAKLLEISHRALLYKLKDYDLDL